MNTELTALVARHIEDVEARERARIVAALRAHAQRLEDEREVDPAEDGTL